MNLLSSANIKNLSVLLLCLLLQPLSAQEDAQADETESYEVQKRIVGGTEVKLDDLGEAFENGWSAVAALLDNRQSQFCGASLIASKWLLTAAHCLYDHNGYVDHSLEITAVFDQTDADNSNLDQSLSRKVINSITHPDYDYWADENDVALLELDQAVDAITPIKLPGKFFDIPIVKDGTLATVLGWGYTEHRYQKTLFRSVQVPVTKIETCKNNYTRWNYDISLNMICAGYDEGGKDACTGDSGGPLLIPSASGTGWDQIGIVSFGIGCGLPDLFGVYTRVSRYHDFIQSIICRKPLPKPNLEVTYNQTQTAVNIHLSAANNQHSYRLYYAPYPKMAGIQYFEVHNTDSISIEIAAGSQWYAAAQVIESNCSSEFSDVVTLK